MNRSPLPVVLAALFIATLGGAAHAGDSITPVAAVQNAIAYVTGVAADDALQASNGAGQRYNLRLIFATAESGAFISNARISIEDANGNVLLDTVCNGSILYADLPGGRYTIRAASGGAQQTRTIKVADGKLNRFVLYWTAVPPLARHGSPSTGVAPVGSLTTAGK